MPVENFNNYTEVDPEGTITRTATRCTFTSIDRDDTGYVYFDKGVGHFTGDFEHLITSNVSDAQADDWGLCAVWALWNVLDTWEVCLAGTGLVVFVINAPTGFHRIHLMEYTGGVSAQDYTGLLAHGTKYLKVERDGNTVNLYVYNDANRTDLEDTLTITQNSTAYRYIYAVHARDDVGTQWITGYSENLDLQEVVAPTVTTQAVDEIGSTTAMGNGTITVTGGENCDIRGFVWDLASQGDPGGAAPGASGYANDVYESNGFGVGVFDVGLTGLPPNDTIYVRAYAHNSAGYNYGAEVNFLTKPAAPTNVAATDEVHTDKVVVTWTGNTAVEYQVYRDAGGLGWLGDVETYDDVGADAATITAGSGSASDGISKLHVVLGVAGEGTTKGTTHTYKVRARNATGESADSSTNTGDRKAGELSYQWQRSDADGDAGYGNIDGATTENYNDTDGVFYPDGRWYRCVLNAAGCAQQITTTDRGFRILEVTKTWDVDVLFKRLGIMKTGDVDVAFKRLGIEKTADADAIFKAIGIETTADLDTAFKRLGIEKTFDIDTLIVLRTELQKQIDTAFKLHDIPRTADVDTLFKLLDIPLAADIDAVFKRLGIETAADLDAIFKRLDIEKSFDIDTLIVLRTELQRTVDAAFQKLGIEKTLSIDAIIKRLEIEKTIDIDTIFMFRLELARQFDILFKRLGIERTADADTIFKRTGIEETFDIDTLIVLRTEVQRQVDVAFKVLGIEKTVDIDTLIVLRLELQRGVDVLIRKLGIEKSFNLDTLIVLRIEIERQIDTVFKRLGVEETIDIDVLFKLFGIEKTADIDTLFRRLGIPLTSAVDSLFKRLGIEATTDIDTAFKRLGVGETFDLDVVFRLRFEVQRQIDAYFRATVTAETVVNTIFSLLVSKTFALDTAFQRQDISADLLLDTLFFRVDIPKSFGLNVYFLLPRAIIDGGVLRLLSKVYIIGLQDKIHIIGRFRKIWELELLDKIYTVRRFIKDRIVKVSS